MSASRAIHERQGSCRRRGAAAVEDVMAFQDRPYYREPSGTAGNPLMWLLMGSVSLGRWFGIEVRIHASLIVLVALALLMPGGLGGPFNSVTFCVVLFGIVLLHEFGHCIASRMVGGNPT